MSCNSRNRAAKGHSQVVSMPSGRLDTVEASADLYEVRGISSLFEGETNLREPNAKSVKARRRHVIQRNHLASNQKTKNNGQSSTSQDPHIP